MFIDDQWKKDKRLGSDPASGSSKSKSRPSRPDPDSSEGKKMILLFFAFVAFLTLIIVGIFFLVKLLGSDYMGIGQDRNGDADPERNGHSATTTFSNGLEGGGERDDNDEDREREIPLVEQFNFGDFYEQPSYDYELATSSYEIGLPLDSKVEVANYYNVNRRINLAGVEDDLNSQGFAIIEEPFSREVDNLYDMYREIGQNQIPVVLTKDLLSYYYQHSLKNSFKNVESGIFYDNLWHITKSLYKKASDRYELLLASEGFTTDPYVLGSRMQAAYLATLLKILEPRPDQTSKAGLDSLTKFSQSEAAYFSFDLPWYLEDDVPEEIELILSARDEKRSSPVVFHEKDYSDFQVPENYQETARLNNVYLAFEWLNSLFPLYYHDEESCPDCKVDRADWRISMMASIFMAHDFNQDHSIKNDWAQIYKLVSFFDGLRDELTYRHYTRALEDMILGEEDDEEEISNGLEERFFDQELGDLDRKLEDLRDKIISDHHPTEIEGVYDHTSTSSRPHIGLRVLSQPYIPNKYIHQQLIYPHVGDPLFEEEVPDLKTGCGFGSIRQKERRCLSTNWDIPNLVYSLEELDYFYVNSDFEGYDSQVEELRDQIDRFDDYTWQTSNYLNTLHTHKQALKNRDSNMEVFDSLAWFERDLDSFLFSLMDTQLDNDKLRIFADDTPGLGDSYLQQAGEVEQNNYIEPNPVLVREMIASLKMIEDMMEELGIFRRSGSIALDLREARSNLERVEEITEKQLRGENLDFDDLRFIDRFVTMYEVEEERSKNLRHDHALTESVEGINLLLLIYERDGRLIMGAGPIFDYHEDN